MNELKLTIQEAQETLLLSQSSVYSWIDKGKLRSVETPGGRIIVISKKEAEEIKNLNLKSRRNKVARLSREQEQNSKEQKAENSENILNPEISTSFQNPQSLENSASTSNDITLQLISKIEELALEAGRFKQLEILRNEEKENVKFWQEKYHELNSELKKKDYEINALKLQIEALKGKFKTSLFDIFKSKNS